MLKYQRFVFWNCFLASHQLHPISTTLYSKSIMISSSSYQKLSLAYHWLYVLLSPKPPNLCKLIFHLYKNELWLFYTFQFIRKLIEFDQRVLRNSIVSTLALNWFTCQPILQLVSQMSLFYLSLINSR